MNRYLPQTRLDEIGTEGQMKLASSTVLIVGCGALGSPCAMLLAGAGVGHVIIADFDTIDISNLQRQFFYKTEEAGAFKSEVLKTRMEELNPDIKVTALQKMVTEQLLSDLPSPPDMIVDAADNPSTTYMLEKYCRKMSIPLSTAGVSGWKGQLYTWLPGFPSFSDIIPQPEDGCGILPCSLTGIIGPLSSTLSSLQASEVIKTLIGLNSASDPALLTLDLLTNTFNKFKATFTM